MGNSQPKAGGGGGKAPRAGRKNDDAKKQEKEVQQAVGSDGKLKNKYA